MYIKAPEDLKIFIKRKFHPFPSNKHTKNTTDIFQSTSDRGLNPPPPPTFFVWHVLFHFSSAYQVIVLKVADGNETLPPDFDSKLKNSDGALQSDIDFYISAEIRNVPVQKTTWEFTIGDEENHEGYKNTALQQGEDYIVFQRALTNDGTEKVSLV